jgi:hypothetical protein
VSTVGFATFGNVAIANLIVTGNFTITATNTQTTNALSINNAGTATALRVTQSEGGGPGHVHNVAEFWDFQTLAMVIDPEGNVAIHATSSPGYALTVSQGVLADNVTITGNYTGSGAGLTNVPVLLSFSRIRWGRAEKTTRPVRCGEKRRSAPPHHRIF